MDELRQCGSEQRRERAEGFRRRQAGLQFDREDTGASLGNQQWHHQRAGRLRRGRNLARAGEPKGCSRRVVGIRPHRGQECPHLVRIAVHQRRPQDSRGLVPEPDDEAGGVEVILKVVNATPAARTVRVDLEGIGTIQGSGRLIVLASSDLKTENSLDQPLRLAPAEKTVAASAAGFDLTVDPQSFTVLRAKYLK